MGNLDNKERQHLTAVAVTEASVCTGAQLLPKDKISFFRE